MRQPKWIGALLLALLVAGGFAWLGQWQLGHAIALNNESAHESEIVRPLAEVTQPGDPVTDASAGYLFSTTGSFVAGDFSVVEQRLNGDEEGAWVVGHFETAGSPAGSLAVALGWAPDAAAANRALTQIEVGAAGTAGGQISVEGRYMPGDAPVVPRPNEDPTRILSMSPAQLANLWQPFAGVAYSGFLVLHPAGAAGPEMSGSEVPGSDALSTQALAAAGLDTIESVPPLPVESINWLNLFYALEWVVFAGFALFFWIRLVRDDWEKTHELRLLAEAEAA